MIKKTYIPSKPRNPKLSASTGTSGVVGKTEFSQFAGSSHEHHNKGVLDQITEAMLVGALRDLITSTDEETELTDENILSSLRVLSEITKNNETFLEDLKQRFLSKIEPDTAQKLITFIEGIEIGEYTTGALGGGAAIKMIDGTSFAEVDNLTVRQKATFRELIIESLKHIGGQLVLTPARMKCVRVVDGGTFYKCYFDTGDGEVTNEFVAGDYARCQVFTGSGTKFYWRLVTLVGEDWINLSKATAAVGSDAPEAGDDITQLGNATDTTRQSAIILSTVGIDAPSWKQYSGINSFSLEGKETTVFSKLGNRISGETVFTSGGANLDDHLDGVAQDILDALQAAQDADDKAQQAIEDAEADVAIINTEIGRLQDQIDGKVSNWYYAYSPTLSNYPASDWTTNEIKDSHIGDTFTNTEPAPAENAGKSWRFIKDGSTYSWIVISDSDALKALQEASKAQATADGKSTTYLFQPTKYKLGDMWVLNADLTVNGTAYRQGDLLTATQDSETFNEAHWLKRVRYTDDTAIDNLQIGGVNLINGTAMERTADNLSGETNAQIYTVDYVFKRNSEYTLSYDIKGTGLTSVTIGNYGFPVTSLGSNGGIGADAGGTIIFDVTPDWSRIWIKYKTANWAVETATKRIIISARANSEVSIKNIMFENGNMPSPYSQSPEDVQASIETAKTEAENAAKTYADTKAEAERVIAEAYADSIVTAEEQARIDDVNAKLAIAKAYAEAQDALLKTQQEAYADGEISKAEQAAIEAARDYADLKKTEAQAYADGIVSDEEARAIADALDKYNASKAHAEQLVKDIEIGGANLLSGLNREYYLNNTGTSNINIVPNNFNFKRNSEYVISYDIKGVGLTSFAVSGYTHPISTIASDGQTGGDAGGTIIFPLTDEWKRVWVKIKTANWSDEEYSKQISIVARANSEVSIRDIMFVSGNKAFDWSPAPEDVQAEIDAAKKAGTDASAEVVAMGNSLASMVTNVTEALEDKVIDEAERKTLIAEQKTLDTEQERLLALVNSLLGSVYLVGDANTALSDASDETLKATTGTLDIYQMTIDVMINADKITAAMISAYEGAYDDHKNGLSSLNVAIENARKAIDIEVKRLADERVDNLEIGGRNLFIEGTALQGKYVDQADGTLRDSSAHKASDFIEVQPNQEYILSAGNGVIYYGRYAFYDGLYTFIKGDRKVEVKTFTFESPNNAKYVRVSSDINTGGSLFKFEKGNKPTDWTPAPEDVQAEIDEAKQGVTDLGTEIGKAFSNLSITNIEANNLDLLRKNLAKEVADVVNIATSISVSVTDVNSKLSALNIEINKYANKADSVYPITVTVANRTAINTAFTNIETSLVALYAAIDNKKISSSLTNFTDTVIANLQEQIDGVVDNWFYAYVPTNSNYPANEWTNNALKDRHIGDTFTNVEPFVSEATTPHAGKSWRWVKDGSTYKWTSIADSDAVKALLEASKAQDTADGKRRVFTTTPKATDAYDVGDLWTNATAGTYSNDLLRCKTAKAKGGAFSIAHWEKASKYTDDTAVDNLEIGGRNLFTDSEKEIELSNTTDSNIYYTIKSNFVLEPNSNYTLSYDVKGIGQWRYHLGLYDNDTTSVSCTGVTGEGVGNNIEMGLAPSEYKRFWFLIKTGDWDSPLEKNFLFGYYKGDFSIRKFKLEKGTKATDWTPAPEDVQAEIDGLGGYMEGAFQDSVIDKAEAKAIGEHLKTINDRYVTDNALYNNLVGNSYLRGAVRTTLQNVMQSVYRRDKPLLETAINNIVNNKTVTTPLRTAFNTAFANYRLAITDFQTAVENARKAIEEQRVSDVEIGGRNLIISSKYENGRALNLSDGGFLSSANHRTTGFIKVSGDTYYTLSATILVNTRIVFFNDDKEWIDSIYIGGESSKNTLKTPIGVSYVRFSSEYSVGQGTDDWKFERGTKATDYTEAPEDVDAKIDGIEIGGRNLLINSNIFTTGWSIVGGAQVIRTPDQVVPEWGATDATKIETVGGSSVTKLYKSLSNPIVDDTRIISIWVKNDSDSNLNININGGEVLSGSSSLSLESGFSGRVIYNARYYTGGFQLQFRASSAENSLNFTVWRMQVEVGNKATDWTEAPEDVQARIDAEKTRINNILSDNVADPSEKQYLSNLWQEIYAEYPRIWAQANAYSVSKTTYEQKYTALKNILDPVLTNLTINSTVSGSSIRTAFSQYYDARTVLQNAITNKVNTSAGDALAKANTAAAITDLFSGFNGGLATAVIMEMREPSTTTRGDATGFISGMKGDGTLPFLGAGRVTSNGVYADAIAGNAKAIIRHDGSAKFTDAEITGVINALTGGIGNFDIQDGELKSAYSVSKAIWDYSKFPTEYVGERTVSGEVMVSVDAVELNEAYTYQGIPSTKNTRITPDGVSVKSTSGAFIETKSELVDGRLSIEVSNTSTGYSSKVEIFSDGIYFDGQKFTGEGGGSDYTHPSTHTASMITAGTLQGIVKANNNTSYTTKQVRNMILSTNDANSSQMANGDIWIKYE